MENEEIYLAGLAELTQHDLAELFGKVLQARGCVGAVVIWDVATQKISSAMILPDTWRELKENMTLGEELSLMAGFIDALSEEEQREIFPGEPLSDESA